MVWWAGRTEDRIWTVITKALWKSRKGNAIRNKIEENYVFLKEDI